LRVRVVNNDGRSALAGFGQHPVDLARFVAE
jgi:hypothetical protein